MNATAIRNEIARIEASRRCWPGLNADEDEEAVSLISDLRADLAEIEDAEAGVDA